MEIHDDVCRNQNATKATPEPKPDDCAITVGQMREFAKELERSLKSIEQRLCELEAFRYRIDNAVVGRGVAG